MKVLDLKEIKWNNLSTTSFGILPKCISEHHFIKLSVFNDNVGFYGEEPIYEYLASKLGKAMNFNVMDTELVMADIIYNNTEYRTLASIHTNFKNKNRNFMSIEKYSSIFKERNILEFLLEKENYSQDIKNILIFDFLVNNIDRHGRNVEIDSMSLAPIFDNSMSFFSKIEDEFLNEKLIEKSFKANNFLGFPDLKENLNYIRDYRIEFNLKELLKEVDNWGSETGRSCRRINFIKNLLVFRYDYIKEKYSKKFTW